MDIFSLCIQLIISFKYTTPFFSATLLKIYQKIGQNFDNKKGHH